MKTNIEMQREMYEKFGRETYHPGDVLSDHMKNFSLSIETVARAISYTAYDVSAVISGEQEMTCDLALRLASLFSVEAQEWMAFQINFLHAYYNNCARGELSQIPSAFSIGKLSAEALNELHPTGELS